jgi:hypothetical protein
MNIKIQSQEFVFFTKGDDVAIINKVMQYVENKSTKKIKIVNINKDHENNDLLISDLKVLDRAYPEMKRRKRQRHRQLLVTVGDCYPNEPESSV